MFPEVIDHPLEDGSTAYKPLTSGGSKYWRKLHQKDRKKGVSKYVSKRKRIVKSFGLHKKY